MVKPEGKRIAVEQRWLNQRTGYVKRTPYGAIAFPRMWDEFAGVEEHNLIRGERGQGPLPMWYVERRLDCGEWITEKNLSRRATSREAAFNLVRGFRHLRVVERNAVGAYEPIAERSRGNMHPRPKGKGSKGMW